MMKIYSLGHILFSMSILLGSLTQAQAESWQIKKQAPSNFSISLPDKGGRMNFAYVPVDKSSSSYSSVEYLIGKDDESLDSHISYAYVSGSIYHQGYWYLLVSTTEVNQAQYASIMGTAIPQGVKARMPQGNISRSEAVAFTEKLNSYLLKQNRDKLDGLIGKADSRQMHSRPYLRLLSETEWEFCARGARSVSKDSFQSPFPYLDENAQFDEALIYDYENIDMGDGTAAIIPVGQKKPNPSGLYDMLGNLSEWVLEDFSLSYQIGRKGGPLVRGGAWNLGQQNAEMDIDSVAAYARREYSPYMKAGQSVKSPDIGFRVVFGSNIISSYDDDENNKMLEERKAWFAQNNTKLNSPVSDSNRDILGQQNSKLTKESKQLENKLSEATNQIKEQGNAKQALLIKQLTLELSRLRDKGKQLEVFATKSQAEAEAKSLAAGVMLLSASCHYAAIDLKKLNIDRILGAQMGLSEKEIHKKKRYIDLNANLKDYYRHYRTSCELLAQMNAAIVDEAFENELKKVKSNPSQFSSLKAGNKLYQRYRKNKKWGSNFYTVWKKQLQ